MTEEKNATTSNRLCTFCGENRKILKWLGMFLVLFFTFLVGMKVGEFKQIIEEKVFQGRFSPYCYTVSRRGFNGMMKQRYQNFSIPSPQDNQDGQSQ